MLVKLHPTLYPMDVVAREQIEEIDKLLFDAGCLVLSATTKQLRQSADRMITDARVKLEQLRTRLT